MQINSYKTLGRSGLRVSPLCLGTMTFGLEWGWGSDPKESEQILDHYIEQGGNFLDAANIYTKGHSEQIIGEYFAARRGAASNALRDRMVITTKFMGNMYRGDPNGGGASRKSIIAACEQSLRRLQTDYIDLYWAHFWDELTPLDEMARALDDLVRAGKVHYLGLSDHPAWVCTEVQHLLRELRGSPLIALQIEYSLAQRTVEAELVPMARYLGLGITPWSPLRGGLLSGKFDRNSRPTEGTRVKEDSPHLTEKNFAIIDTLKQIAQELSQSGNGSVSVAQVAIAWLLHQPGVSSVIIGARTIAQLKDNLGSAGLKLTEEQLNKLDQVSAVTHPFPYDFLKNTKRIIHGGATVEGVGFEPWELSPEGDADRW